MADDDEDNIPVSYRRSDGMRKLSTVKYLIPENTIVLLYLQRPALVQSLVGDLKLQPCSTCHHTIHIYNNHQLLSKTK